MTNPYIKPDSKLVDSTIQKENSNIFWGFIKGEKALSHAIMLWFLGSIIFAIFAFIAMYYFYIEIGIIYIPYYFFIIYAWISVWVCAKNAQNAIWRYVARIIIILHFIEVVTDKLPVLLRYLSKLNIV